MPRGRHRHSPPLHRILPPSVVAGVSVVGAAGAWLLSEPLVLRGLVAAVAAAAVTGAYLMRSWDRAAGLKVAELTRARASDEWRAEERIAELEQDLEESRELRTRLETKLRRKRVELAGLRGEHAGLLRRYANAETERASALEGRRQLVIEASSPKALLPARSTPTPESYRRADEALMNLTRNAKMQEARRTAELVQRRALAARTPAKAPEAADAQAPAPQAAGPQASAASSLAPATVPRATPAASPVVPYAARRHLTPQGAFDYFGNQGGRTGRNARGADARGAESSGGARDGGGPRGGTGDRPEGAGAQDGPGHRSAPAIRGAQRAKAAIESVQHEDLADVVGEEALAAHRTGAVDHSAVGKVIDLTAHDETEPIDVARLRGAVS
ncbi:hypothetical protein ACFV2A_19935 [Streptomyces californicus]|uniref:hypothetical protein n=1 Tax=Streptomyces californicus TaxID=67351 RepID=UPI001E48B78D|nr:hypothetical protein [Streptomyces californicus]MCC0578110.1 hypothetical protein [Streptomyces californicus]